MENAATDVWKKCSACKRGIAFGATYYVCSVSTCNGQRTGYVFCTMTCFEAHLPGARHRDAGAVEKTAPRSAQAQEAAPAPAPGRRMMATTNVAENKSGGAATSTSRAPIPREILVVVSKVKDYIRARSEMNTSDGIMQLLSERIREICDEAIDQARVEGRKTVLDRDLPRKG